MSLVASFYVDTYMTEDQGVEGKVQGLETETSIANYRGRIASCIILA